jgi:hypothetical protein
MSGDGEFNFEVLRTPDQAIAYLAKWVLAFFDSLWLDTHGHLYAGCQKAFCCSFLTQSKPRS